MKQDEKPCLYIYEQTWRGRTQTGIVGCTAIDDYINDVIKSTKRQEPIRKRTAYGTLTLLTQTPVLYS